MALRMTDYLCLACRKVSSSPLPRCHHCGGALQERVSIQTSDSATMIEREQVVGRESRPGSEAIVFKSFDGMRSHATLADATVQLTLSGPLDLGKRPTEARVAELVVSVLRAEGRDVTILPHDDPRGEDSKIKCDGALVDIQVVTVPRATQFLSEANQSSAYTSVPILQAAAWINDAVSAKAAHYSPAQNAQTLLAIDVRHVAVLATKEVMQAVDEAYGNPCKSHGFGGVWLVGPEDSLCTRFSSSRW